jgi:hypothetical protein
MSGVVSMGLGLLIHHVAAPVLERAFGPFTKATTMATGDHDDDDDEITLTRRLREIDDVLDANADKAPVREQHAIHSEAITALNRCAAEASRKGCIGLAKHFRDLAIHTDKLGAISLRLTATRAAT